MTTSNKKINREISADVIKLAVAWANDEVSLADVARELGTVNMTHSYTTLARALKQHVKNTN
jgi:hypothetical protein